MKKQINMEKLTASERDFVLTAYKLMTILEYEDISESVADFIFEQLYEKLEK